MSKFRVGDKVVCVDDSFNRAGFLKKGQEYEVRECRWTSVKMEGSAVCWLAERFVLKGRDDLTWLKGMLTTAGVRFESWPIKEYIDRARHPVPFEGFILTFGAEDYGPYTEFLFNVDGSVFATDALGARSAYFRPEPNPFEVV